jgi:hypothetical protein
MSCGRCEGGITKLKHRAARAFSELQPEASSQVSWPINWLLVQVVFRSIAWVFGAAFALARPWLSKLGAFLAPWLKWFDPAWAEVIA